MSRALVLNLLVSLTSFVVRFAYLVDTRRTRRRRVSIAAASFIYIAGPT
jgi:hypothetical protein